VYYGNVVAGPVFKEIADKVYATSFSMHDGLKLAENQNKIKIPYTKHSNRTELKNVLNRLNIEAKEKNVDSDWVVTRKKDSLIDLANRYIEPGIMPNVTGMGVKDAVYILEKMGLNVKIKGRGSIQEQSIQAGTPVDEGDMVILKMTFQS
jgi:cell division protein FtsI (penicillin-binding protein 3)